MTRSVGGLWVRISPSTHGLSFSIWYFQALGGLAYLPTHHPFAFNKPAFKTATDEEEEGRRPSSRDLAEVSLTATASGQHERKEKNRGRYNKTEENPGSLSHADQKKGSEGVSKYSYVHEEGKNR